jgi:hypothetical protein
MPTLAPPARPILEQGAPSCEEGSTSTVSSPEEKDGKITSNPPSEKPKPLQGEGDTSKIPGREHETGTESEGT